MLLLTLSISLNATADCQKQLEACNTAVGACKAALDARKKEVDLCSVALTKAITDNGALKTELSQKDEALGAFYRNPFVMLALGLVGGLIISKVSK